MANEYVKRLTTADGGTRITVYREEYAENPRYMTDEPLHCEDWHRSCSIMLKKERESASSSARKLLEYLLSNYVDYRKVIDTLVAAGKNNRDGLDDKLVYDCSAREWMLCSYGRHYDYETRKNVDGWYVEDRYDVKKYEIDVCGLLEEVCDGTIDHLAGKLLDDKVKVMSYSFGYDGDVSFSDGASCSSDGIAWLEKKEFLKYSGCDEKYWRERTCKEIDWLHEELEAWGDNDVYIFCTEKLDRVKVHETHQDGSEKCYDREDWNKEETVGGFYGTLDKCLPDIVECAGYRLEELKEME